MASLTQQSKPILVPQEDILVVERTKLLGNQSWHGCKPFNGEEYLNIIQEHKQFLPRSMMELDPHYKQIIPYLIFTHNSRYFLMQRKSSASEQRLKNKLTLGIGGHIRKEDLEHNTDQENVLFSWAIREFHEEVDYHGTVTIEPLCIINDDTNEVGKVHIGFALLVHGDSGHIQVKSELKQGQLASLEECMAQLDSMESWSQMALAFIGERTTGSALKQP